jgi:hypothetical protein
LREIEALRQDGIAQFTSNVKFGILSRSIPTIFPIWSKFPKVLSGPVGLFPKRRNSGWGNESSIPGYQRIFCQRCLQTGSSPEGSGECSDYNSGEGSDTGRIPIKEVPTAFDVRSDDGGEGGWIVFVGGILVGVFVVGYAIVERLRK